MNVLAGIVAGVLLLSRSRRAALVALIAPRILLLVTFSRTGRRHVLGPALSIPDVVVAVLTLSFWVYCRALSRRGMRR